MTRQHQFLFINHPYQVLVDPVLRKAVNEQSNIVARQYRA